MHILLYEWVTGGGLVEETGRLPESMRAEGSAMVSALAADFLEMPDAQVTCLRDMRLDEPALAGCHVLEIHSASQRDEELSHLASRVDYTLAIAPEFDRTLQTIATRLSAGSSSSPAATSLNASDKFIRCTGNKNVACERLTKAGVPVPWAQTIAADEEKLPADFPYPGVLKPIDGAGSQHTMLIEGLGDQPPPYPWPRRLERFYPGRPASVAFLCGPAGYTPLPPCWQHLSQDDRFGYLGGTLIGQPQLAQRAVDLASRALNALPPARGYVGVDLILGEQPDASGDVVLEINPRLTTSYVGLRHAIDEHLASQLIAAANGQAITITPSLQSPNVQPLSFDAVGTIS